MSLPGGGAWSGEWTNKILRLVKTLQLLSICECHDQLGKNTFLHVEVVHVHTTENMV